MLLACLALRDAFTNKQRQRRLETLARQRAAREAKRRQEEDQAAESTASRLDRTGGAESVVESGKPTMELDESDRRVAVAAAGLAALTTCCDSPAAQNSAGEQGPRGEPESLVAQGGDGEKNVRESDGALGKCTIGGETCAGSGERDAEGQPGGVDVSMEDVPQEPEVLKSTRFTPSAPPADSAPSHTLREGDEGRGSGGGKKDGGLDLVIEGKQAGGTASDPAAPPERMPLPPVPENMNVEAEQQGAGDGWAAGDAEAEREGEEAPPEDIEAPLRGIERCKGHLRAAHHAFGSLLEALAARDCKAGVAPPPGEASQTPPKITSVPRDSTTAAPNHSQGTRGDSTGAKNPRDVRGEARGPDREGNGGAAVSRINAAGVSPKPVTAEAGDAGGENVAAGAAGLKTDSRATTVVPMKLGGENGGFAFESEMNRHLLGSSPHHHVHFRWGRGDGVRALRVLAREAATACGVIKCRDLADIRRHLLSFMQPPLEVRGAGWKDGRAVLVATVQLIVFLDVSCCFCFGGAF